MNRSYIPETQYRISPVSQSEEGAGNRITEALLCFFDLVIAFFSESTVRATLRVIGAVLCFIGFLFVVGAVETGAMTFAAGILTSALLVGVAFLCVYRRRARVKIISKEEIHDSDLAA